MDRQQDCSVMSVELNRLKCKYKRSICPQHRSTAKAFLFFFVFLFLWGERTSVCNDHDADLPIKFRLVAYKSTEVVGLQGFGNVESSFHTLEFVQEAPHFVLCWTPIKFFEHPRSVRLAHHLDVNHLKIQLFQRSISDKFNLMASQQEWTLNSGTRQQIKKAAHALVSFQVGRNSALSVFSITWG